MTRQGDSAGFTPGLNAGDPTAEAWLQRATLLLRREVCWHWHQGAVAAGGARSLLQHNLDLVRFHEAKQRFFAEDVTAHYLSERIAEPLPLLPDDAPRGSFAWLVKQESLDDVACLAYALALLARLDAAARSIIAACLNDPTRDEPTISLVQHLADSPADCLGLAVPSHPLWRLGLLQTSTANNTAIDWEAGFRVPSIVAEYVLGMTQDAPVLTAVRADPIDLPEVASVLADRLRLPPTHGLRLLPLRGASAASFEGAAAGLASLAGRGLRRPATPSSRWDASYLQPLLTLAWLEDVDLLLREEAQGEQRCLLPALQSLRSQPVTVYLMGLEPRELASLPPDLLFPPFEVPHLEHEQRAERLRQGLGRRSAGLDEAIEEAAYRYRLEADTIDAVCEGLREHRGEIGKETLFAALRAAVPATALELAEPVTPRFDPEELVLPPAEQRQLDEIERAMRSLARVHFVWGAARVWNESGVSALFTGPSGTGKTMAAEVLAAKLDLPMYRINLAQVVNKYIGETEKNLERVFDSVDACESVLFFDEADSLFGRRTEVHDSHDRYANLEVSYLLQRMERFKGLVILATNRRRDLDDAFVRRLRYIVEFPFPDVAQRRLLWHSILPGKQVDTSSLDIDFLARQFHLSGGNIRSAVFNACLQSATGLPRSEKPALDMDQVVIAVKREYDKMQRTISLDQLGPYAELIEGLEHD